MDLTELTELIYGKNLRRAGLQPATAYVGLQARPTKAAHEFN